MLEAVVLGKSHATRFCSSTEVCWHQMFSIICGLEVNREEELRDVCLVLIRSDGKCGGHVVLCF